MPRECVISNVENVKEQGIDCRHVMTVECLRRTHYSPAKACSYAFRSTGSDPVGAARVVRPMSAALNGSGRRKTASRSADEQHR